eukprot:1777958-Rhodomonas_salina.1
MMMRTKDLRAISAVSTAPTLRVGLQTNRNASPMFLFGNPAHRTKQVSPGHRVGKATARLRDGPVDVVCYAIHYLVGA